MNLKEASALQLIAENPFNGVNERAQKIVSELKIKHQPDDIRKDDRLIYNQLEIVCYCQFISPSLVAWNFYGEIGHWNLVKFYCTSQGWFV